MKTGFSEHRAIAAILCVFLASFGVAARANGDLDSITFAADEVVEARVAGQLPFVSLTSVLRGSLKVGDQIVVENIGEYQKKLGSNFSHQVIGAPDRFILLLCRSEYRKSSSGQLPIFTIVDNGLYLVTRGRIGRFHVNKYESPRFEITGAAEPVGEFVGALKESLSRTAGWRQKFDAPPDHDDAAWLLEILRAHPPSAAAGFTERSATAMAASRIVRLGDFRLIDLAIDADSEAFRDEAAIHFASANGREYLLATIGDLSISTERRSRLIQFLQEVSTEREPSGHPGGKGMWDAKIISTTSPAKLAKLAALPGMPLDSATKLIEWISLFATESGSRTATVQLDFEEATAILNGLYIQPTTGENLQFQIELALHEIGDASYERLHARTGPIVSIPIQPTSSSLSFIPGQAINFDEWVIHDIQVDRADLVLEPVASSGKPVVVTVSLPARPRIKGQPPLTTMYVPQNLAPGRYVISLQFFEGEKMISQGHKAEIVVVAPPRPKPVSKDLIPPALLVTVQDWAYQIIAAAIAVMLIRYVFRSQRRIKQFRSAKCLRCGYDLRASSDCCPECGTKPPAALPIRILRSQVCAAVCGMMLTIGFAALVVWVRSYWIADCVINTTPTRADAIYSASGSLIFERPCLGSAAGWNYERDVPAEMVRSAQDAGLAPDWRFLGAQRAAAIGLTVIPMLQLIAVAWVIAYAFWRLSRAVRSSIRRA